MYSIEVISTYYVVSNLWKAFFCAVFCCLTFTILRYTMITDLLTSGNFQAFQINGEMALYAVLGVICGVTGAVFVHMAHTFIDLRKRVYAKQKFAYTLVVAGLCAMCTYAAGFLQLNDKDVLRSMFSDKSDLSVWEEPSFGFNLLIYTLCKLVMTAVSYSAPVPCGVFIPTFTAGATLGRLYGYLVQKVWHTEHIGVFAATAAAALTSSATHTISVAIIVFELTGDLHYLLAMSIAVLISYAVGNSLSASIYDYLFDIKDLPYLPTVKSQDLYSLKAGDFANSDNPLPFLTLNSDFSSIIEKIEVALDLGLYRIPLVDDNMTLIADFPLKSIRKYLISEYKLIRQGLSLAQKVRLDDYFSRLWTYSKSLSSVKTDLEAVRNFSFTDIVSDFPETSGLFQNKADWMNALLGRDEAPLLVMDTTGLGKVHFMFLMLGLRQVYVTRKGALVGVITKDSLSKQGR